MSERASKLQGLAGFVPFLNIFGILSTIVSRIMLFKPLPFTASARQVFDWLFTFVASFVYGAKFAAKRFFLGTGLAVVILWTSMLFYASFYHFYVPSPSLTRPAHFQFRVCPSGSGVCSFPLANVSLCSPASCKEALGRGQQYRVIVELKIPDSARNRDVGMFMVSSKIYGWAGETIQDSSRAMSVKYQSDLLRSIQTLALFPLYVTDFVEESQTLSIELFDEFWDDYYQPAVGVVIELQTHLLTFYTAELQFHAWYTGLRYYLYYYPTTSAVCGIMFNCLWLSALFILSWYRVGLNLLEGFQSRLRAFSVEKTNPSLEKDADQGAKCSSKQEDGDRTRNYIQPFTTLASRRKLDKTEDDNGSSGTQPITKPVSLHKADAANGSQVHIQPFSVSVPKPKNV